MMRRPWVLAALAAFGATSCASDGLAFTKEAGAEVLFPKDHAEVELPIQLRWRLSSPSGRYAVFLDHAPIAPGKQLRSLVDEDDPCHARGPCPDAQWFADNHIWITDRPTVTIDRVPRDARATHTNDRHYVTIVPLQGDQRAGERVLLREFFLERGG